MKYTLMHKHIPVVDLILDESTGAIQKIEEVHHAEHLPLGVSARPDFIDRTALNAWWLDRSIPASRSGIRKALETLRLPNTQMLLTMCFGLSLSDQYWVRLSGSSMQWEQINFFTNDFSEDIGDVLMGKGSKLDNFDFHSPDNTSDGFLKKRWKIIDGKRCLIKGGSAPFMQQPFNEVIASSIARRLDIPHVPYELIWDDGKPYSVCECFVTPDTELVSAWRVMQTRKKDNSISLYRHYINCCESFGLNNIAHDMDQMIVLDYLIANEDRHQNNFGLLRNPETLQWLKPAPIFDSGSSFGYDKLTSQILSGKNIECKPFKKKHEDQLGLVTSFDWIDFKRLDSLSDECFAVFDDDRVREYLDDARRDAIVSSLMQRVDYLKEFAADRPGTTDCKQDDVQKDVAETYL